MARSCSKPGTHTIDSQILLGQGGVDKPLTIVGETAADGTPLTSIQPASGTRCFYIYVAVGPGTIIENLVITGGSGLNRGAGMYCKGDPTVINCHFLDNAAAERGGGMYNDGGKPTLNNCTFTGNSAPDGGAMYNTGNSDPILTNSTVCDNSSPQISGDYTDGGGNCIAATCDLDSDGIPDCVDQCLGEDDTLDSDGDGTPDCLDGCENDPDKTEPGDCGCGVPDTDTDGDGIADCNDPCPNWPYDCSDDGTTIIVAVGQPVSDAIEAANNGDVIEIAAGTYNEHSLNPGGKVITIQGTRNEDGTLATTIDAQQGGSVFMINSGEEADTHLTDLIITGGMGYLEVDPFTYGGGIYCKNSSPTITGCTISDNNASQGGGIYCVNESNGDGPTISNCRLVNNNANVAGGGISSISSNPTIAGCTILNNSADSNGGGIQFGGGYPTITDCTIKGNSVSVSGTQGGGIYCDINSSPTITNCSITDNTAPSGGGVAAVICDLIVSNCTISGNTATYSGGGIFSVVSNSTLTDADVCGNIPDQIDGDWIDNGGNCITDSCEDTDDCDTTEACPADADGNGVVDVIDLLAVIDGWGTDSSDLNGDGTTDVLDLLAVIDGWGICP